MESRALLGNAGAVTMNGGTLYVVRHAKAGSRSKWSGDDAERPLTESGRRQAEALAERMANVATGSLLTSSYLRCRQTLEPLSHRLGAEVHDCEWLAEGSGGHRALTNIVALPAGTVMCSHGDVITEIVDLLIRRGVPVRPVPSNIRKGSVLEIDIAGEPAEIVAVRYVEPPSGDPDRDAGHDAD